MDSNACVLAAPILSSEAMDDATLLARYLSADATALNQLLERHAPIVRAVCRRRLDDHALADDAAQAAFQVLATKAASIREPRALSAWLHRTALNACDHVQRSERRRRDHESKAGIAIARERAMSYEDETTDHQWDELRPHLDAAVNNLRPAQRDAVIGYYLQGKPQAKVAAELGCSKAAVKMRLQDALERLRVILTRRGVVVSVGSLGVLLAGPAQAQAVEPGFTAACLAAAQGDAPPAVQAISSQLNIAATVPKIAYIAAAILALAVGTGIAVAMAGAHWTLGSSATTSTGTTEEVPVNKLSILSAALIAAAAAYPQDAGGPTPPRVTVEPVGPTTPSVTVLAQDPVGSTPHRFTVEITSPVGNAPQDGGLQRQSGLSDSTNASGVRIGSPPGGGSTSAALPRRFAADRAHEVELVILPTKNEGNSPAVLARWSELAAKGYTVDKIVAVGDHIYMFMQREATTDNQHVTLPEVVEKDASLAECVRVKIVKWNETPRTFPQPVKQTMPPQRPAPVQPAQADPETPPATGF